MKKVYDSVEDIDLFVGLTLEDDFDDALIGETFICLIAGCRTFQHQARDINIESSKQFN